MWKTRHAFNPKKRRLWDIDIIKIRSDFERRYALGSILAFSLVLLIVTGPFFYFFAQNQGLFTKIAYQTAPSLVEYLEREMIWFSIYSLSALIATIVFTWIYVHKVTSHIISPVLVLQNHIKELRKGKKPFNRLNIRNKDEFQDLISEYNLLLDELQKRNVDLSNPTRESQPNDHAVNFEPPRDSRHVS